MKHAKKLASLLLALAMVLSMSVTAFAGDETGSITIDNAIKGQTYTIYEILKLESYNSTSKAYVYKSTTDWSGFINSNDIKSVYVNVDDNGYVTWVENASAADFAKAAQKYAKDKNIGNQGSKKATSDTVTFTDLELGYYLVDSSLGALCSLDTTKPSVTIKEKNVEPTNEKKVEEDSTGNYGSVNDADIGQTVKFQSTITVPLNANNENNTTNAGAQNYVFHDKMSEGLTYNPGSVKVYLNPTINASTGEATGNPIDNSNYRVTSPADDGDTFDVNFTENFCNNLKANDKIVISYSATVNDKAVVGGDGNTNSSKLSYGDESETEFSTTTTYTWSFDVLKYGNGNKSNFLQGAKFVLLNNNKNKVATIVSGKLTGWVDIPAAGADGAITWPANTTLTTNKQGKINIEGLDADTYYLREIAAPQGYNKLKDDHVVIITPTKNTDGTLTLNPVTANVNNQSGTELPSTGGRGTTIFYVIGSILLVGAAVLLITRKRMSVEK